MEKVGSITDKILAQYKIEVINSNVYVHQGTFKHISKRHPDILNSKDIIIKVLDSPDYIGQNPKEKSSLELIKKIDENYLVAIKIDIKTNNLIVASTYKISDSKLQKMILSNRVYKADITK